MTTPDLLPPKDRPRHDRRSPEGKRAGYARRGLGIPLFLTYRLLDIPREVRVTVLGEVVRVGPGAVLAAVAGLPDRPGHILPRPARGPITA